jgi:ABC-type proline/glycine betaine transport system substrate-binding protein
MKRTIILLIAALFVIGATGCGTSAPAPSTPAAPAGSASPTTPAAPATPAVPEKKAITFAEAGWDSIMFHNAVAGTIAEAVFGYTWSEVSGSTPITHEGIIKGEIDIHMETWTDNLPDYPGDLAAGRLTELSTNFDDNYQGLYVPRYVIEGDSARGIAPMAPDLKHVKDLAKYAHIFPGPEDSQKGVIYGGTLGWAITVIMENKVNHYGLDEMYNYVAPGTDAAMNATIVSAFDKGEPIVAYYWEPTWLMGKYDFVLLEDEPYIDDEAFKNGETECPPVPVMVCVSNDFAKSNPEFCEFLSKYETSSALTGAALAYMQDKDADYVTTAKWFLNEHPELVDAWLTADQAAKLRKVL